MSEKELAVQVTQVDGVKVDNMDFAEARQDEVFEELASNAAGANQQHARLVKENGISIWSLSIILTSLLLGAFIAQRSLTS